MDQSALESMLSQGRDNVLLRFSLGSLFFKNRKWTQALEHLQCAVELDPTHSASWKLYGRTLDQMGETEKAREIYQKGISVAEEKGDIQAVREMQVFLKRLG